MWNPIRNEKRITRRLASWTHGQTGPEPNSAQSRPSQSTRSRNVVASRVQRPCHFPRGSSRAAKAAPRWRGTMPVSCPGRSSGPARLWRALLGCRDQTNVHRFGSPIPINGLDCLCLCSQEQVRFGPANSLLSAYGKERSSKHLLNMMLSRA